ncbi:low affinity immunoglobulin gamma Fc region receptor III-like [Anabas testudineus]|uniref:low affinity immunoglobulin gamma Fc region receptor III-like n=1 Tax=Anabas testudineus TaxID=64144 RepID=UPI00143D1AD1|nr:low affinity immunoglobulin gamma Fc region receptor III-like [Anabas testudineus]
MKVTALCIRLSIISSLLLVVQLHFSHSLEYGFPQVVPNRQQHFEYETFTVSCEGLNGLTGWRVMRKIKGVDTICASTWETSTGPCEIKNAYEESESGEYWCEMKGVNRSKTVNITVSAASVILESPVLPVMEGDDVTLSCRNKQTPSTLTAEFYKDGFFMGSSSTAEMTIPNVSKSNDGLYKCSISGAGESAESWLTVTEHHAIPPTYFYYLLLCICVIALLFSLLLIMGLILCTRHKTTTRDTTNSPSIPQSSPPSETGFGQTSSAGLQVATYTGVPHTRKEEVFGETSATPLCRQETTYALITKFRKEQDPRRATSTHSATVRPHLTEEDIFYSTIQ